MARVVIEHQTIQYAQHVDLIYSLSNTLYDFLPNAPRNSNALATHQPSSHVDDIVSTTSGSTIKQLNGKYSQFPITDDHVPTTQFISPPILVINFVHSTQKPNGKNKNNKKNNTLSEK